MSFNKAKNLEIALSFDDVLLVPQYSEINSRTEVDLATKIAPNLNLNIPLISTNMDTITGAEMAIEMSRLGGMAILPRFGTVEEQAKNVKAVAEAGAITAASIGVKRGSLERAEILVTAGATVLDIDVAHGHMKQALDMASALKNKFGDIVTIFGGIAATGKNAEDYFKAGADSVMLGIGGGSICTTRIQTGCGLPTLASILDAQAIARKYKKTIVPLAGIRNSGDAVKALAAGASAIRGGNIFSGTDKTPGEIIEHEGKKYKRYNGSASYEEKLRHIEKDSTDKTKHYAIHVEGVSGMVEYKGTTEDTVNSLLAGIKSGLSYCGAKSIEELWQKAEFVRVTTNSVKESKAHDIIQIEINSNDYEKVF